MVTPPHETFFKSWVSTFSFIFLKPLSSSQPGFFILQVLIQMLPPLCSPPNPSIWIAGSPEYITSMCWIKACPVHHSLHSDKMSSGFTTSLATGQRGDLLKGAEMWLTSLGQMLFFLWVLFYGPYLQFQYKKTKVRIRRKVSGNRLHRLLFKMGRRRRRGREGKRGRGRGKIIICGPIPFLRGRFQIPLLNLPFLAQSKRLAGLAEHGDYMHKGLSLGNGVHRS